MHKLENGVVLVNPDEACKVRAGVCSGDARERWLFWLGAYGWTRLVVWARSCEKAIEVVFDWCEEHEPGHFCDDSVAEEYERAVQEGKSEEEAQEEASIDTISSNSGHYMPAWEVNFVELDRKGLKDICEREAE